MSIILAIDYGELKCGLAVTDKSQVFAFGLITIETENLMDYLEKYCIDNEISAFVIGQPKRMNDKFSDIERLINIIKKINDIYNKDNIENN